MSARLKYTVDISDGGLCLPDAKLRNWQLQLNTLAETSVFCIAYSALCDKYGYHADLTPIYLAFLRFLSGCEEITPDSELSVTAAEGRT